MVAIIQRHPPDLFSTPRKDGNYFKCSEAYIRKILHNTMGWSKCRATKAAQKLLENHEEVAILGEASVVHDHGIPDVLRVNTDQTQLVHQQGTERTWNKAGVKQNSTIGQDEKRAFPLIPSISPSGVILSMQAIFMGKTGAHCPNCNAPAYAKATRLGFQMLPSKSNMY